MTPPNVGIFSTKLSRHRDTPLTAERRQLMMARNGQTEITVIDVRPRIRSAAEMHAIRGGKLKREFKCGCELCPQHAYAKKIRTKRGEAKRNAPKEKKCARAEFGCASQSLQLDHILPVSKGGDNSPENLQWLCHQHHVAKTWRKK